MKAIKVKFQGGRHYTIKSDEILCTSGGKVEYELSGNNLTITDDLYGDNNSVSIVTTGGRFFSNSVVSGCSVSNVNGVININTNSSGPKTIIVDGRRIDIGSGSSSCGSVTPQSEPEELWKWKPDFEFCVTHISIEGTSQVTVESCSSVLDAKVAGSGDIRILPEKLNSLTILIAGSGDVYGNSLVGNLQATVAGSGDITGFTITNQGQLNIFGSGDISLKKYPTADVSETVCGSGDIKVKKVY